MTCDLANFYWKFTKNCVPLNSKSLCRYDSNAVILPQKIHYAYKLWFQDGNGGIWLADIEVSANVKPLRRLAKFHGDAITSLQASPIGYFIATTSLDGWMHVYDVLQRQLVFTHNFRSPITSLIWLPLEVNADCRKSVLSDHKIVSRLVSHSIAGHWYYKINGHWLNLKS